MSWQIVNFVEPNRVRMMWQSASEETRTRFHVGDLVRAGSSVALFYNWNHPDLWGAFQAGFQGHPAFGVSQPVHHSNVIEIISRRLPPRSRSDFGLFLFKHGLANNPNISDLALIGYTGARLPADGFSFEIDFSVETLPFQFYLEIAGFRYYAGMNTDMSQILNQPVVLIPEPENDFDHNALQIFVGTTKIGYVPKSYAPWLKLTAGYCQVMGMVSRIEGSPLRPQVHVYLSVARANSHSMEKQRALF